MAAAVPGNAAGGSRTSPSTVSPAPLFTAIDLTPDGFSESWANGIAGERQVGYGSGPATGNRMHALLWRGSAASVVDLNPSGFDVSWAVSIFGDEEVGAGRGPDGAFFPLLWRGSAADVMNMHPDGFGRSEVTGNSGGWQVGWGELYRGYPRSPSHALLWHGRPASVKDLHPRGYDDSWAVGIFSGEQVGMGDQTQPGAPDTGHPLADVPPSPAHRHALLWRGSAASAVDLHPRGFDFTWAVATAGGREVGYGDISGHTHALLWHGSAASVEDLHAWLPAGFLNSSASGVNLAGDVSGVASGPASGNHTHAVLWHSRTATVIDLHQFLPSDFVSSSAAWIDADGNIVGSATKSDNGATARHAFLWRLNVTANPRPGP